MMDALSRVGIRHGRTLGHLKHLHHASLRCRERVRGGRVSVSVKCSYKEHVFIGNGETYSNVSIEAHIRNGSAKSPVGNISVTDI